ncbi:hypothetical protein [Lentzea jiangxiensis]|uniref:Proteins of 100 residues with WXG n=1 Tax=Lentzea jiangxiensis TaxID=641025 RepID=A0A1H0DUQ7_9PSEU|nr:hypothetical protein [Lentzea jiangxiensis]SDN73934.1 hypothetical protein SAMN05421507_101126 [Lentzea jiangxiensis]
MTTASYQSVRPVAASLKQPEVDRASLNDVLQEQGWGVQAVNWVFEAVTGESLVATIITPITGDWSKIRADGDAWRMVGNAMNDVSYNLTDAVGKVRDHWDGDAARAHEKYIALGWKAGLLAEMGVAQLIAKGFDTVASGAEALGKQAARLLDYLVNKLLEAAATVWIPVGGWIKAAEMVWNAYQIYRRVMDIIETVQKLIADVKALFDAVGRVFSAIGKLKDADSLAEAMNATQEVAEAGRDVRNSINDIRDDMTAIKDSATEIVDRGQDIGTKVREVTAPPGASDAEGTKPAAVSSAAPGGAPVAPPPAVQGGSDAPATHAAAAGGPAVAAPPSTGGGSGGAPVGAGGHGGSGGGPVSGPPTARPGTATHVAGAAPAAAPPTSSHQTPMAGAMPMGAPMAPGAGGGDQTRSSGSRPGAGGVPAFPSAGAPRPTGLPTPPGQGSGLPTPPGIPAQGSSPAGTRPGGLPTPPSGPPNPGSQSGAHPSGTGGTHPTPPNPGSHPAPGSGLPTPPNSGGHQAPGTGSGLPTPPNSGSHPSPGSHPAPGSGLPTPPNSGGHQAPGTGSGLPTPPNSGSHPSPGSGLPTPPDHPSASSGTATAPAPSTGGGLPSPPGHPSPSTDHSAPSGTTPHDNGTKPHDTTPSDGGTRPHDPTPADQSGPRPHDTDTKTHDGDPKPHDTDTRPDDGKPHDTGTSGAEDAKPHDPTPATDPTPPADRDPDTRPSDEATTGNNGDGDGSGTPPPAGPDLKGHFDAAAMAAQGQGYQHQLEQILPNQADRDRYVELSQKLSTDLSADEAQHVADVRNQIKVDTGDIVTKALSPSAVSTYLPDQPHAPGSKGETWQNQMAGSVARGQDVVDVNTPQGLRDGLALDDKGKGWTPIPEGAPSAMQLRYELTDQNAGAHNVPFGGPKMDTPDFTQPGPYPEGHYQSPQEKAHYEASQKQMAAAGGSAKVYDGYDPFTGTGSTMGGMPEWRVDAGTPLPDRAEIWQVNDDGSEKLHAVYDRKFGWTKL